MLKERVYQAIKHRIILQDLKPGDRLNERELMEEYTIGKTPLREIFLRLQHEGLIRRFPRSGTIVSPIDFKELRDAAEIRLELEGLVAKLAVRRISPRDIKKMEDLIGEMERAFSGGALNEEFIEAETSLHTLLYELTDNSRLKAIIVEQHSLFARLWFSAERTGMDLRGQIDDWKTLYAACRDKDEERAAAINREHFHTFYDFLRGNF